VLQISTPSIYSDVQMAEAIKSVCPNCTTVAVGPHVSALAEATLGLSPALDAVARGEHEFTLLETARAIADNRGREGIQGLVYRDGERLVANAPRPLLEDLDVLPMVSQVYHRHLNFRDYFYSIARWPEVEILTGRGCPHFCIYCVYPQTMTGRQYRFHSIDRVVEEFQFIKRSFPGVREVFIEDDTLTVNRARCIELCERLIKERVGLGWTANSRAEVDYETLRLMKAAGCRLLCVGFESGVQQILDSMNKGNTLARARQFVGDAKRAGIMIHGCFLVGNPGETESSMRATLEFAKSLNIDTAQFFPIMVYPGTESYRAAKASGYLRSENFADWITPAGMHNCMIDLPGLSAEQMVAFCDLARREYYLRPRYLALKLRQVLTDKDEARRTFKSLWTFRKYLFRGTFRAKPQRSPR
jgi:anaerobic magnesium-protoporphyrin IX monomethyl ester cyclase